MRVLEWRYGEQLDWRLVLIGLTEHAGQYEERGYTPLHMARGQLSFRRYGMPFAPLPKARVSGTGQACRAVVAVRQLAPGREWAAFEALQLASSWPTSPHRCCSTTTPAFRQSCNRCRASMPRPCSLPSTVPR